MKQLELFPECTQNWCDVEDRLQNMVALVITLKHRWDNGERTRALAEEIMAVDA